MNLTSISINVSISQFPTSVLITELRNRIDDNLHDPEPQDDLLLNVFTEEEKNDLLAALNRVPYDDTIRNGV